MIDNNQIKRKLKILPKASGVYLMLNKDKKVIYVGKAKVLKNRVKSYFNRKIQDDKVARLVENIADIQWFEVDSELEALMLETNLIKKYRPKYNVLMKDDKNYVYLKITKEEFPRVYFVRKIVDDGSKYFGPYTDKYEVEELLRLLNRLFPFFRYSNKSGISPMNSKMGQELFYKRAKTVWGDITDPQVYEAMIADFGAFMSGKSQMVKDFFCLEMNRAAAVKDFERAAWIRDRLEQLQKMMTRQVVVVSKAEDVDVISSFGQGKIIFVCLLVVRTGKLIDIKYFEIKNIEDNFFLDWFLVDYYSMTQDWPQKIFCEAGLNDHTLISDFLYKKSGKRIKIFYPMKSWGGKLISLAKRNAKAEYQRKAILMSFARNKQDGWWDLMKSVFGQEKFDFWKKGLEKKGIFRVEAYDISNLGDKGVVGALVVWESKVKVAVGNKTLKKREWYGDFQKSLYKRFQIKTFEGQDDFGALKEVLGRRFKHREKGWEWPDIILIDGGKGQLSVVMATLIELGIDLPTISLAKQEEEVWLGKRKDDEIWCEKLSIEKDGEAGLWLREVRDEIHRFVIGYQRATRKNMMKKSILDEVEGLGPKTKKKLLAKYGSVREIKQINQQDLIDLVGKKMAEKIRKKLMEM